MKQRLTSLAQFEQALLGKKPIVLLFTSDFCHACRQFEHRLSSMVSTFCDVLYFELRRGEIPGLEKTFHLITTPAVVFVSEKKDMICERNCEQMSDQALKIRLEELYETNRSIIL